MKCHRIRPGFGSGREPGEDSTASSLKLSAQLLKSREAAVLSVCDEFHEDGVNIVPSLQWICMHHHKNRLRRCS